MKIDTKKKNIWIWGVGAAGKWAADNITSNIIELGAFDTGMYKKLNQKIKNKIIEKIPSNKLGQKRDIINTIKFIIDTSFMNGSVVKIDGGAD